MDAGLGEPSRCCVYPGWFVAVRSNFLRHSWGVEVKFLLPNRACWLYLFSWQSMLHATLSGRAPRHESGHTPLPSGPHFPSDTAVSYFEACLFPSILASTPSFPLLFVPVVSVICCSPVASDQGADPADAPQLQRGVCLTAARKSPGAGWISCPATHLTPLQAWRVHGKVRSCLSTWGFVGGWCCPPWKPTHVCV